MSQNSILILGSFAPGALEIQYLKGFEALHWQTHYIDIQLDANTRKNKSLFSKILYRINTQVFYKNINEKTLAETKKIKPTVILVFKGMELYPETIQELKTHCKLICNYNPDHPFHFFSRGAGNENVKQSIPSFDIHFSYSKKIMEQLYTRFQVVTHIIPFGYDNQIKPIKFYNNTISNNFIFVGAWDRQRASYLETLTEQNLLIFGPENWKIKLNRNEKLWSKLSDHYLFEQNYADACTNALGVLNFLRPQNLLEQSHNMRTFEVPGYGGLLFSQRTEEQLYFFEEDKEAIFFDDITELKDKLSFYNSKTSLIKSIKMNAFNRSIKSNYDYFSRCAQLVKILNEYV